MDKRTFRSSLAEIRAPRYRHRRTDVLRDSRHEETRRGRKRREAMPVHLRNNTASLSATSRDSSWQNPPPKPQGQESVVLRERPEQGATNPPPAEGQSEQKSDDA
jgi:hypothetical protein